MVRQETWTYNTWFGKCSIHYANPLCILYNDSTLWCYQVWLYCSYLCTYQYIITKLKQPNIKKFRSRVHEYASGL